MDPSEKIEQKFSKLLNIGRSILIKYKWNGGDYGVKSRGRGDPPIHPSPDEYLKFRIETQNLIRRVCGENSDHYLEVKRIADDETTGYDGYFFYLIVAALEASYTDYKEGLLFDLRSLVAAELLGDILDQAKYLVDENYYVAAASLAGAVLEDSLRKLSQRHKLPVPTITRIDSLNVELAKAGAYNTHVQKKIGASGFSMGID